MCLSRTPLSTVPTFRFRQFLRRICCLLFAMSLGTLLLLASVAAAQDVPFVLPWNDASRAITDFSAMNSSVGSNRVGADTNGHFVVNGARIRFLGMNFAGDSPFAPTNNADAMAARLAKFGINVVR